MVAPLFRRKGLPLHKFPTAVNTAPSTLGAFVSNASAPQIADYGIVAGAALIFVSAMSPQGPAPSSEYTFGTHAVALHQAEALKTKVWPAATTQPLQTGKLGTFTVVPPPVDLTQQGQFYKPLVGTVAGASYAQKYFVASPQDFDLSISSWVLGSAPLAAGPVPPYTIGLGQFDPTQIAAQVWEALVTPPVTSGKLGAYAFASPQAADFSQQGNFSKPLIIGQGRVPPSIWASQDNPSQLPGQVWPSLFAQVTSGVLGATVLTLPQNEERPVRQVWPSQFAGQTTPVLPFTIGGPQRFDFTQQAMFTPAAITQVVIITGTTVFPNAPVPPQADTTVNPSIVWTPSTFSPSAPVVPVVDTATPGRTLSGRTLLRPPFTVESDEDKRARRAREAAEEAPKAEKAPDISAYYKQSARISKAISDARAEADTLRPKIAELEAKAAKAKLTAKLEKQLLHAQQQLTLISVQEAVLQEEMEAIDVAFIALIAYLTAVT